MPRYFFDIQNDDRYIRDKHGIELPSVSDIWEIAVPMVDEIAKSKNNRHSPHTVSVVVRDTADLVVYRSRCITDGATSTTNHDFEFSISNGPNARPRDEPIGQTAKGLSDDASEVVDITPE